MTTTRLILSMWQPWATLVLTPDRLGRIAKRNETRGFPIRPGIARKLPLEIIIHAAQRTTEIVAIEKGESDAHARFRRLLADRNLIRGGRIIVPLGAVIGVVKLVGNRRTEDIVRQITQEERLLGDYSPGRWAWFLSEPRALPISIQFKGRQSVLWPAPSELDAQIEEQLEETTQLVPAEATS